MSLAICKKIIPILLLIVQKEKHYWVRYHSFNFLITLLGGAIGRRKRKLNNFWSRLWIENICQKSDHRACLHAKNMVNKQLWGQGKVMTRNETHHFWNQVKPGGKRQQSSFLTYGRLVIMSRETVPQDPCGKGTKSNILPTRGLA